MYFVRSGFIYPPLGSIRYADYGSGFRTFVAYPANSQDSFTLRFDSTTVIPSDNSYRYVGFALLEARPHTLPIYFVRSGNIYLPYGSLRYSGHYSLFWSLTSYPVDIHYAFNLGFNSANAHPSHYNTRYNGFSLQMTPQMYFVRSGYIYIPKASLNYASGTGAFWSATPTPLTDYNSFYLLFGAPRTYTSDTNTRHNGFTLHPTPHHHIPSQQCNYFWTCY